jgi:hypothetical protein
MILLAAQPAAAVAPDAQWCPGGINCVTYETFQQAVDAAKLAGVPGHISADAGVFAETVTVNGLKNVSFFGGPSTITGNLTITNSKDLAFVSLTVQGVNGFTVDHCGGGFLFSANQGSLNVKNSTLKNPTGIGLQVISHNGPVILNKVNASNNLYDGAYIDNRAGNSGVGVAASKFDKNGENGLKILTDQIINIVQVSASMNGADGANFDNTSGTGGVVVHTGGSGLNKFDKNVENGLYIKSKSQINVFRTSASKNGEFGATLINDTGTENIFVGDTTAISKYDGNGDAGLFVQTAGGVALRRVSASGNLEWGMTVLASSNILATDMMVNKNGSNGGAILLNYTGSGDVIVQTDKLKMNHFDKNGGVSGLSVLSSGDVALIDISAVKNAMRGVKVDTIGEVLVAVKQSKLNHFDNNGNEGLIIEAGAAGVQVKYSTAYKNGTAGIFDGFQIDTSATNGNAVFACSKASKNTGDGIQAMLGAGQLFLNSVSSTSNGGMNINSSDLLPTFGTCP